jgi:hypothetical protein
MLAALLALGATPVPGGVPKPSPLAKEVSRVAGRVLDEALVSYVYGGYQVGDGEACKACNDCLAEKTPKPKDRLKLCGVCNACSLDCSHFANLVFKEAGAPYPYLDTKTMLALSAADLKKRYGLIDVGSDPARAAPGDFLVYEGHMVILEKRHKPLPENPRPRGDVIHATGGKDVKGPGEGIQRERFIDLGAFRGPLLRILRHQRLANP